ncbi:zinc permease [uncultured Thiothrix sp.]|jgi:ZIP family zinc transporter|uniref:zinc permease n=1 Tax=uncultured Thiothrix sp. TaxID=223185 RepID=UPI0026184E11|nr:zinc permease [uncultured Thiothrix sp.]HMT91963.1 zinc permease [Thiolinea sp.]
MLDRISLEAWLLLNQSYLIMLIPALVAVMGGVLAMVWHPSHQTRSLIQHFAAGVVLAALAVEVLPDIQGEHASGVVIIIAFALGSLFMYVMKLWAMQLEAGVDAASGNLSHGLVIATFVDIAVDGFIIGAGFAAGGQTGLILALGLSVELLFLGLSLTAENTKGWRIIALSTALGVTVLMFAVLGRWLLAGASHDMIAAALAFSAAALLYLVTEELLIEAHEVEEKPIATLVLFAGFLVFWSIQLLGTPI